MKVNKLLTIACHKYVSSETSEKNNFVWNMIGSMIFAAASMILSLLIIRIVENSLIKKNNKINNETNPRIS